MSQLGQARVHMRSLTTVTPLTHTHTSNNLALRVFRNVEKALLLMQLYLLTDTHIYMRLAPHVCENTYILDGIWNSSV